MRWYHKALAWAGVLLTAVAFPGSGWAAAKAPTLTPITIAQTSNALGWAADYLALVNGDFRREGLDVRLLVMNGDAEALPAVIAGDAQFGAITTISTMEAIAKGQDLKIIAPFTDQFVAQFIIRKSLVKKLGITASMPMDEKMRRIKGLIVGTPDVGGSFQLLFNGLAKMAGLDPNKDFTVTAIHPYPAELDALKRGQIDVGIFPIPTATSPSRPATPPCSPTSGRAGCRSSPGPSTSR